MSLTLCYCALLLRSVENYNNPILSGLLYPPGWKIKEPSVVTHEKHKALQVCFVVVLLCFALFICLRIYLSIYLFIYSFFLP